MSKRQVQQHREYGSRRQEDRPIKLFEIVGIDTGNHINHTDTMYGENLQILNTYRSNVELHSTSISVLPSQMSSSNRHVILQCFMLVFACIFHLMATSELRRSEIFWKINLDQTVAIHNNNLDCKARMLQQTVYTYIQGVPLATERGNEDIAMKFEQEQVRCVRNEEECLQRVSVVHLTVATRSSNILISGKIIKEMPGSVASGTPCTYIHNHWASDLFSDQEQTSSLGHASKHPFLSCVTAVVLYVMLKRNKGREQKPCHLARRHAFFLSRYYVRNYLIKNLQ